MNIAYVVIGSEGVGSGIMKKVGETISIWRQLGHKVTLVMACREYSAKWSDFESGKLRVLDSVMFSWDSDARRVSAELQIVRYVQKLAPDFVYLRNLVPTPGLLKLPRICPVLLEINTEEFYEYALVSPIRSLYYSLVARWMLSQAHGFVVVSNEIANSPHYKKFNKPTIVIANGAIISENKIVPPSGNIRPRFVCLFDRDWPWVGIDKLRALALALPEFKIDLIGALDPARYGLMGLPNVTIHGRIEDYNALRDLLSHVDIGISTIALHRNRMSEASPLKSREYLSHGIPIITGYDDTDFPRGADFLLQLPNTEDNIVSNLGAIVNFAARWVNRRLTIDDIKPICQLEKERKRLDFAAAIVRRGTEERAGVSM